MAMAKETTGVQIVNDKLRTLTFSDDECFEIELALDMLIDCTADRMKAAESARAKIKREKPPPKDRLLVS
jgi:predicted DNA-binding transcriptional regulator YafY